jgi:RNA polymerase sigma-70 factor (ECF subfamily)
MTDDARGDGATTGPDLERGGGDRTEAEARDLQRRLRASVARVCPRWLADHADDIVQSAMVRALEARRRGGEIGGVPTINLTKLAYWTAMDEVRARVRRRREVPVEEALDVVAASSPSSDPERSAGASEIGRSITDCLGRLARARRLAVTLHLQGHSFADAGRLLGWTTKRVEHLVYRGLSELRRCLEAKGVSP